MSTCIQVKLGWSVIVGIADKKYLCLKNLLILHKAKLCASIVSRVQHRNFSASLACEKKREKNEREEKGERERGKRGWARYKNRNGTQVRTVRTALNAGLTEKAQVNPLFENQWILEWLMSLGEYVFTNVFLHQKHEDISNSFRLPWTRGGTKGTHIIG